MVGVEERDRGRAWRLERWVRKEGEKLWFEVLLVFGWHRPTARKGVSGWTIGVGPHLDGSRPATGAYHLFRNLLSRGSTASQSGSGAVLSVCEWLRPQ